MYLKIIQILLITIINSISSPISLNTFGFKGKKLRLNFKISRTLSCWGFIFKDNISKPPLNLFDTEESQTYTRLTDTITFNGRKNPYIFQKDDATGIIFFGRLRVSPPHSDKDAKYINLKFLNDFKEENIKKFELNWCWCDFEKIKNSFGNNFRNENLTEKNIFEFLEISKKTFVLKDIGVIEDAEIDVDVHEDDIDWREKEKKKEDFIKENEKSKIGIFDNEVVLVGIAVVVVIGVFIIHSQMRKRNIKLDV